MNGKSKDIKQEQIEKLKQLFPEAVTEGKVDLEKLKATLGEEINSDNERYVLNRVGEAEVFREFRRVATAKLARFITRKMEISHKNMTNTGYTKKAIPVIIDKSCRFLYNRYELINKLSAPHPTTERSRVGLVFF